MPPPNPDGLALKRFVPGRLAIQEILHVSQEGVEASSITADSEATRHYPYKKWERSSLGFWRP